MTALAEGMPFLGDVEDIIMVNKALTYGIIKILYDCEDRFLWDI
jgi:hypothetical protein